ncbi:MAG TPA: (deoxy)nucleoside triphosphate pyrophosphohydrolase [Firmicutes bacterium]|jgi:8-oxo-dGTP diphosphatase|nr:(deoxy)nucleoside triphosphate pyrophosphohydrolase [Bacillota bacterium]HHT42683.1 (deoxy)nucleoside triphosphate pyrophosphohydrolase [Bacillota bacterium]
MPLPVIAAVIRQGDEVLLCQRREGALAGKWEFPGGKLEDGETPEQCLVREIQEELGIQIEVERIYKAVHTHYDHGDFLIIAYLARHVAGAITLRVHADCAWVDVARLGDYDLAEANIPIAQSLKEDRESSRARVGANSRAD